MELYAKNMHFLGETEENKIRDCCIHGEVFFKIDNDNMSDGGDWNISASGLRFLKTIFENRIMGDEDFLIPCCGHFMIASEDKKSVEIIGCNSGIDFDIIHNQDTIIIKTQKGKQYEVPFEDYKNAILTYAEQITDFYKSNPPREFYDNFQRTDILHLCMNGKHYITKRKHNYIQMFPSYIIDLNKLEDFNYEYEHQKTTFGFIKNVS